MRSGVFLEVIHAPIPNGRALAHLNFWEIPTRFDLRTTKFSSLRSVAYLKGPLCEGPLWPHRRDFCNCFGIVLAPLRDKIAATSDQMRFFGPEISLKCVCGRGYAGDPAGGAYSAPPAVPTCLYCWLTSRCAAR